MKNEQKFYSALENIFIGEAGQKIEGKSGYVNLMKLKSQYFAQIKPFIEKEVNETFGHEIASREEAFQKLFTFFESYLNETGTPYFSQTPFHKNLYEKVYSERDDVALFWKTQRLYYVKSEANYNSLQNLEVDGLTFNFDASQIEHQKNNEKKTLEFWATKLTNDSINFKVVYQDNSNSKWERLKEYLQLGKPEEIRKHLIENFGSNHNPNILYKDNGLNREGLKVKQLQSAILITNNNDLTKSVTVEFALSNLEDLEVWAKQNQLVNLTSRETAIKKAQQLYKKQNEVDYFIHKDAEGFLKEQLDIFLYQYLFGDRHLGNEWTQNRIDTIQKLKRIAHKIIIYIARFEDELKHIWEKKKIVKQVNYVFTLDNLNNNIDLLEKIISHKNFEKQTIEWIELGILKKNTTVDLIQNTVLGKQLNSKHKYLPLDTKFFDELKFEIINSFENIDDINNGILIKSDNWQGLNSILPKYNGSIRTTYIDPPFNLENNGDFDYKVNYKDSTWLTILENRLELSKQLLKVEGSTFVRCDYNGNYLVRDLLNQKFNSSNFRNEIIVNRFKRQLDELTRLNFAIESLFYYANSQKHVPNKIYRSRLCTFCGSEMEPSWRAMSSPGLRFSPITEEEAKLYSDENIIRTNGKLSTQARIIKGKELLPPKGRHWTFTQERVFKLEAINRLRINDEIDYTDMVGNKMKGLPEYLQTDETPVDTSWTDLKGYAFGSNFSTENAEELLKRVIQFSSNEGEWIIDYFLGSATTVAVSHKINRKWIGIEVGEHYYSYDLPRLKEVLAGDKSGISKDDDVNWKGGGFFKYYELEQYEECLQKARFNTKWLKTDGSFNELEQVSYYTFKHSDKLLDAMVIDEEKEEVKIHFQNLYPEMDEAAIAETISNVSGKAIKTISKEKVVFADDTFIEFANMRYDDPIFKDHYRSLLWWKSKE